MFLLLLLIRENLGGSINAIGAMIRSRLPLSETQQGRAVFIARPCSRSGFSPG
jgi:hypothetical protein